MKVAKKLPSDTTRSLAETTVSAYIDAHLHYFPRDARMLHELGRIFNNNTYRLDRHALDGHRTDKVIIDPRGLGDLHGCSCWDRHVPGQDLMMSHTEI